jgi:hypothetical protein
MSSERRKSTTDEMHSDWQPDLSGPHWQPTGGPNGEPLSIAIGRPASPPKTEEQRKIFEIYQQEMENAEQMIIPDDEEDEVEEGPPHRDPPEGSKMPRKLGTTATGWEVWLDESMFSWSERSPEI